MKQSERHLRLVLAAGVIAGCARPDRAAEPEDPDDWLTGRGAAPDWAEATATSTATATSAPTESALPCPAGMVLVDGMYCPLVRRVCRTWLDERELPWARCGEYEPEAACLAPRAHRRFCIDREEYADPGEDLPANHYSWTSAVRACQAMGKRLCLESEWQFACEGEAMLPYPYGLVRDATACNFDRDDDLGRPGPGLRDHREPRSARPRCTSPFGVHDMVGNIDEWATRDGMLAPRRAALRGGWWLPGRNRCRAATREHDEAYEGVQTGFRCCADAAVVASRDRPSRPP